MADTKWTKNYPLLCDQFSRELHENEESLRPSRPVDPPLHTHHFVLLSELAPQVRKTNIQEN